MSEPIQMDLKNVLAGHHILIDPDELTFGLLEDLQSDRATVVLDALANCIVGGDLPNGTGRKELRRLQAPQISAVLEGVAAAFQVPKR